MGKVACGDSELGLYETQQEEKSKPISRYPIPYEKDLPFDIVELTEEVEKKVRSSPHAGSQSMQAVSASVESLELVALVCPSFPVDRPFFGVSLYPSQKDVLFSS